MKKIPVEIEFCANHFGLNFNNSNCLSMSFHTLGTIKFGDFTVSTEQKHYVSKEVHSRLSACFAILRKPLNFWKIEAAQRNLNQHSLMHSLDRNLFIV